MELTRPLITAEGKQERDSTRTDDFELKEFKRKEEYVFTKPDPTFLIRLPADIQHKILIFLSQNDLQHLALSSKKYKGMTFRFLYKLH